MAAQRVTVDNFARAETDRMFAEIVADDTGVNTWNHNRVPSALDHQPVIRMNRDAIYSPALVDLRDGAVLSLPDAGQRYLSAVVVNRDHHVNHVIHETGDHELTVEALGTDYLVVAVRILVDPADADDVSTVNALRTPRASGPVPAGPSSGATTTRRASGPRGRACSSWPAASPASTTRSARVTRSTRSVTSSARPPAGPAHGP